MSIRASRVFQLRAEDAIQRIVFQARRAWRIHSGQHELTRFLGGITWLRLPENKGKTLDDYWTWRTACVAYYKAREDTLNRRAERVRAMLELP